MTIPIAAPIFLLCFLCVVPNRVWDWFARWDWFKIFAWTFALSGCVAFWVMVGIVVGGVV